MQASFAILRRGSCPRFIGYDKFEARERVALGNGTATNYSYNPLNRRLTGLLAQTKSARTFMAMSYGYDAVGNIKTLANAAAVPTAVTKGGATSYSFGYDVSIRGRPPCPNGVDRAFYLQETVNWR